MKARDQRMAHVTDAFVVECPARLLVEMRKGEVPENGVLFHRDSLGRSARAGGLDDDGVHTYVPKLTMSTS